MTAKKRLELLEARHIRRVTRFSVPNTLAAEARRVARALPEAERQTVEAAGVQGYSPVEMLPEGTPSPVAPVGTAAYFEAEAARCEAVRFKAHEADLPDGVSVEALETFCR